jgi:hypothetical protein
MCLRGKKQKHEILCWLENEQKVNLPLIFNNQKTPRLNGLGISL